MREEFLKFLEKHRLFEPAHKVLLAVSGGVDSMVLVDLFRSSGMEFGIAHCNYNLRGDESREDEAFVRRCAASLQVPFHVTAPDVRQKMEAEGMSLQEAARELRYSWFRSLTEEHGYDSCAVAHHSTDSAETMLLNLAKGTGLAGLHGIPVRNGRIIRPLLFATRAQVLEYARKQGIAFREDSSNVSDKYLRNRIRHHVLPALREINPSLEQAMSGNAAVIRDMELILADYIAGKKMEMIREEEESIRISIPSLQAAVSPGLIAFELLKPYGFNASSVASLLECLPGEPGKVFLSATHKMVKDREKVIVYPLTAVTSGEYLLEKDAEMEFPVRLKVSTREVDPEISLEFNKNTGLFDADLLNFPLLVRKWRKGDVFSPLGMKGRKKLSDFFIDSRFSLYDKENAWLLVSGQDIIWVAGHRIDERYKVTLHTRNICIIEFNR
jgi:tRNA(Ile)-lysidine synthase